MKSIASSIQPSFAAASTRHWSRVIVRYHGTAGDAAATVGKADAGWGIVARRLSQSRLQCGSTSEVTHALRRTLGDDDASALPSLYERHSEGYTLRVARRRHVRLRAHRAERE